MVRGFSHLTSCVNLKWLLFILVIIVFIIPLYLYASSQRDSEIKGLVDSFVQEESLYLVNYINNRLSFIINDLLDTYKESPPATQEEHTNKTRHLISSNSFIKTINFIGSKRRIEFASPLSGNEAVIGLKKELIPHCEP